jgi:hypothetical protein
VHAGRSWLRGEVEKVELLRDQDQIFRARKERYRAALEKFGAVEALRRRLGITNEEDVLMLRRFTGEDFPLALHWLMCRPRTPAPPLSPGRAHANHPRAW